MAVRAYIGRPRPYRSGDIRFEPLLILFDAPCPRVMRSIRDAFEILDDREDALAKLRRAAICAALRLGA
jgi:hypothetical protein